MTPQEFKAWFNGYAENISAAPTEEQWKRIRARVDEVDGTPITPIYVEHRWPTYGQWPSYWINGVPYWAVCGNGTAGISSGVGVSGLSTSLSNLNDSVKANAFTVSLDRGEHAEAVSFTNNFDALYALGKAESVMTFTQQ